MSSSLEKDDSVRDDFVASSSSPPVGMPSGSSVPVLENPDHQTKWYFKYFLGKFHRNFVCQQLYREEEGPSSSSSSSSAAAAAAGAAAATEKRSSCVLSLLEERSFGKAQHRAILWTKFGPKRLCLRGGAAAEGSVPDNPAPKHILPHFGSAGVVDRPPKEVSRASEGSC